MLHTHTHTHLGTAYNVGSQDGSQLLPVLGAGQPALPLGRQGAQSLVCGPEDGEGLVDGHGQGRQQPCLLSRETPQSH